MQENNKLTLRHVLIIDIKGAGKAWRIADEMVSDGYIVIVGPQPRPELRQKKWRNAFTYIQGALTDYSTIEAILRCMADCKPPLEAFDNVMIDNTEE